MTIITPRGVAPEAKPTPAVQGVPAPVAPEAPKVSDELLSPKFAALARQQKQIRQQQQEIKAEREALAKQKAEYESSYVPKARLKQDPYAVLTEEGLSYDDIVKGALSQNPQDQAIKRLEAKLDAESAARLKLVEDQKANEQKQYETAVNNIRNEAKLLVDSNPAYETIKAHDVHEAIVDLIKDTFDKEGKILDVEDAASQVEEYLLEEAVKLSSLEKVKQRLAPKVEEPVKAPVPTMKPQAQTLTNTNTTAPSKPLSKQERRERAILAFQGKL